MNKKILLVVFACTNMCITIKAMNVATDTAMILEMVEEEKSAKTQNPVFAMKSQPCPMVNKSHLAQSQSMMAMLAAAELSGDPKKIAYVEYMIKAHNNHHQVQQDAFVQKPMIIKQSDIKPRAKL